MQLQSVLSVGPTTPARLYYTHRAALVLYRSHRQLCQLWQLSGKPRLLALKRTCSASFKVSTQNTPMLTQAPFLYNQPQHSILCALRARHCADARIRETRTAKYHTQSFVSNAQTSARYCVEFHSLLQCTSAPNQPTPEPFCRPCMQVGGRRRRL